MLPKVFGRMLMGHDGESRRKQQPLPAWELEPGAVHPSQGGFVAVDPNPPPATPVVTVEPVDASGAQSLADEIRRLAAAETGITPTPSRQGHPQSRPGR